MTDVKAMREALKPCPFCGGRADAAQADAQASSSPETISPQEGGWQPIETKPPLTHVEERGEYQLWYFKPTHWRPLPAPPAQGER
jgi:hypothetical protein